MPPRSEGKLKWVLQLACGGRAVAEAKLLALIAERHARQKAISVQNARDRRRPAAAAVVRADGATTTTRDERKRRTILAHSTTGADCLTRVADGPASGSTQ